MLSQNHSDEDIDNHLVVVKRSSRPCELRRIRKFLDLQEQVSGVTWTKDSSRQDRPTR